jgi:hypothetical protein
MVQVITLPMDGGYKPRGNLAFEPYPVRQKRLGLPDVRNKGPLSLIPEAENEAHKARMAAYWKAIHLEEEAKKVHTCADWEFDMDEESPSVWCPACHHADWLRHSKAGQQLIVDKYMREMHPELVPAPRVVPQSPPTAIKVTPFMKDMIEIGDATALMLRDSLTPGMSRPWWYYCEKADSEWLTRKAPEREALPTLSMEQYMAIQEQTHGPVAKKAPREEPYRPAEPSFFNRVQKPIAEAAAAGAAAPLAVLSADEGKRMAAFAAWDATDRDVRKPFHKGRMVPGNCRRPKREVSDAHKVMLRNLPLEVESLRADMWELIAQVAPVTFLEGSKGIYVTLATPRDVDAVMARFPNGVNYMGNAVTFERVGIARR